MVEVMVCASVCCRGAGGNPGRSQSRSCELSEPICQSSTSGATIHPKLGEV